MTDLRHLAQPGARLSVRVTTRAKRNAVLAGDQSIRILVTTVPEDGKANAAVVKLLAEALGVAKSRLTLLRGATARDKLFQLD
jgi:uncharacterized protein YggU (UPF0235/DUF167 family)